MYHKRFSKVSPNAGSEDGTMIEETDLADHFDSRPSQNVQASVSHQPLATVKVPVLWSHSPVYPGLITSPSLNFQSHLPQYSDRSSASPTHLINRQMIAEANFLASFIPIPNHDTYYQDPHQSELVSHGLELVALGLGVHSPKDGSNDWERILQARGSYSDPFTAGTPQNFEPHPHPTRPVDPRRKTSLEPFRNEQQSPSYDTHDQNWEEAITRAHGIGTHLFSRSVGSPESVQNDWKPSQNTNQTRQHSLLLGYEPRLPSTRRSKLDHRGRIKLGNQKTRICLRALQSVGSLIGFATLTVASIILHPDPPPVQLKSLQVYLFYLISILSLSLSAWRVSKRLYKSPPAHSKIESEFMERSTFWGGGKRARQDMQRRIAMDEYSSYGHRNAPQLIYVNFIIDGRLLNGATPNINQSPHVPGRLQPSLDPGLENLGTAERGDGRFQSLDDTHFDTDSMIPKISLQGSSIWTVALKERCNTGDFEGWCNAYNTSIAIGVILASSFLASTWSNIRLISNIMVLRS
ncbi:hypothetical protein CROQUDRAFT_86894 [Cronartium quercuum f. sp. fusiforme G11]|uniref:Uncharacterized protein n=1 Tax=Cronartium quercuum f. sp. fusiforme G11 TaxID=708437 RepID=A0A9P6NWI2_9BASI|nr:hypothetical protein CROQUDRAFT_86894 [Cronartium quercuum f. sp. fusiforme G11]